MKQLMNEKNEAVETQVVHDAELIAPNQRSARMSVVTFLLDAPVVYPVEQPVFTVYAAKASFIPRLGASALYLTKSMEYALSPNGMLSAYLRLLSKWFVIVGAMVVCVGVLGVVSARFMEATSAMMLVAMKNFFETLIYLVGCVLIIAALGAGVVLLYHIQKGHPAEASGYD